MKSFLKNFFKNIGNSENGSDFSKSKSPLFFKLAIGGTGVFFFLITVLLLIIILFGPVMLAGEYIGSFNEGTSNFFEKVGNLFTLKGWCTDAECDKDSDQKYDEKLKEVYDSYKKDGVVIDTDLITGTIYYGSSFDDKFDDDDGKDSEELVDDSKIHLSDIKSLASNMVSGTSIDYSKYRNYLINTYVPKRFSDLYENDRQKENIVDEIMMYASGKVNIADNSTLNSVYEECSKVCSTDGKCFNLEEFVIRVVDHESGAFPLLTKNYAEQWKAQAVAARTVTLQSTDFCKKPVELANDKINIMDPSNPNSRHDDIAEVVKETAGQILTIDNKPIVASWDSFYKGGNYHCDDSLCYSTYQKIGLNGQKYDTHEVATYKKWQNYLLGGHGYGLSQYGSAYLADTGWKYTDILKYYYDDRAVLSSMTGSSGNITGTKYTSNPPVYKNESYFYSHVDYTYFATVAEAGSNGRGFYYYGECPWFARGRAREIIGHSNMPDELKQKTINHIKNVKGNGADWYNILSDEYFAKSKDLYAAKPGSIVSWSGGKMTCAGGCGHVGIVEDVKYDSNGKATEVLLAESYNGSGTPSKARYTMKWWKIENFKKYNSNAIKTYYFNGYVYLLDR